MTDQSGVLPLNRDEIEELRATWTHLSVDDVRRRLLATCDSQRMQAAVLARIERETVYSRAHV